MDIPDHYALEADDGAAAMMGQQEEWEEWMAELARDEAARAEYVKWMVSTYTEGNEHEPDRNQERKHV